MFRRSDDNAETKITDTTCAPQWTDSIPLDIENDKASVDDVVLVVDAREKSWCRWHWIYILIIIDALLVVKFISLPYVLWETLQGPVLLTTLLIYITNFLIFII